MSYKLENYFFNILSSATLNLVILLILLFLFQSSSSALKNCCIMGNQIPKIVEDALYRRSEKDEDNNSKREQEQEPEDRWMAVSRLMLCI